jgi:hypothetical protein
MRSNSPSLADSIICPSANDGQQHEAMKVIPDLWEVKPASPLYGCCNLRQVKSDKTLPRYNVNTLLNSATTRTFPLGAVDKSHTRELLCLGRALGVVTAFFLQLLFQVATGRYGRLSLPLMPFPSPLKNEAVHHRAKTSHGVSLGRPCLRRK